MSDHADDDDPFVCRDCGVQIYTDSWLCTECAAAQDCALVADGGFYYCLKDGSEECGFECPNQHMIGTKVRIMGVVE